MLIIFKKHLARAAKDDLGIKIEAEAREIPNFYDLSFASAMHMRTRSKEALGVLLMQGYSFECILDAE